jgi:hypothetical protein
MECCRTTKRCHHGCWESFADPRSISVEPLKEQKLEILQKICLVGVGEACRRRCWGLETATTEAASGNFRSDFVVVRSSPSAYAIYT